MDYLTRLMKQIKKCMDNLSSCFCWQKEKHRGLHRCRCGGSWDKTGMPHSFPDISRGFNGFPLTDEELKLLTN